MSSETFDLIGRLPRDGRSTAMATLVGTAGTTPRKEGTKMFVGQDGDIFGSVTIGGCVDVRVIEEAAEVLRTGSPRFLEMQLGDDEAWEIGLTCGGAVDVFIEPVTDHIIEIYEEARRFWLKGCSVAIVNVLRGDGGLPPGTRLLADANGMVRGEAPIELSTMIAASIPPLLTSADGSRTVSTKLPGGEAIEVYIEVLRPPQSLLIFGATAVAIPLVTFARTLGFRTVVIDGRARFACPDRFPDADEIRVGIASEIAGELQPGPTTAIILVVHDYKIDVPVLKRALASDAPYIGLLGSRRRGVAILQMLRDEGVPEEQLLRVRVPIGLDLGGSTTVEIALSIVAEVVAVLHQRSGGSLSAKVLAGTFEGASP